MTSRHPGRGKQRNSGNGQKGNAETERRSWEEGTQTVSYKKMVRKERAG